MCVCVCMYVCVRVCMHACVRHQLIPPSSKPPIKSGTVPGLTRRNGTGIGGLCKGLSGQLEGEHQEQHETGQRQNQLGYAAHPPNVDVTCHTINTQRLVSV